MGILVVALLTVGAFEESFDAGVEAYSRGDYRAAIEHFDRVAANGSAEAPVYYNLGNAYYRDGQLGMAIAQYERALHIDPNHSNARENLERSLNQSPRGLAKPLASEWERAFLFWHQSLLPTTSFYAALVCWFVTWTLLALRAYRRIPYLRGVAIGLGALAILFAASWWSKTNPPPLAVVTDDRVPVRYGKQESETVRFELFEGDRVEIDEQSADWVLVRTIDGERGWARSDAVTRVFQVAGRSGEDSR